MQSQQVLGHHITMLHSYNRVSPKILKAFDQASRNLVPCMQVLCIHVCITNSEIFVVVSQLLVKGFPQADLSF